MNKPQRKTKVKDAPKTDLSAELNQFAERTDDTPTDLPTAETPPATASPAVAESAEDTKYQERIDRAMKNLFEQYEGEEFNPVDFQTEVPVDSLESKVGYSSLIRQMHRAYVRRVAYHRSKVGGALPIEEARARAFRPCTDKDEALKVFDTLMSLPVDILGFADFEQLYSYAPRSAERVWEWIKQEGRAEFESGHLAANITFPEGYMKQLWNIARYLGVRESFIDDWQPQGGIEVAMIDMMAQSYSQWQYWLEQTVKRSETREIEIHPEYSRWLEQRGRELKSFGITDGYWNRPHVSEQQALDSAVQMADRFNRIFMRTLRQLRDLRRYAPVTINNPQQVNIAADGGQQINIAKTEEEKTKKIIS